MICSCSLERPRGEGHPRWAVAMTAEFRAAHPLHSKVVQVSHVSLIPLTTSAATTGSTQSSKPGCKVDASPLGQQHQLSPLPCSQSRPTTACRRKINDLSPYPHDRGRSIRQ